MTREIPFVPTFLSLLWERNQMVRVILGFNLWILMVIRMGMEIMSGE